MEWYDANGDVQLGGTLRLHKQVEDVMGNDAVFTPPDGGQPATIRGTLQQATERPDELDETLAMMLIDQVFRVRRAVRKATDFPRSTDINSTSYGQLEVAGKSYGVVGVGDDASFVYLHLATAE